MKMLGIGVEDSVQILKIEIETVLMCGYTDCGIACDRQSGGGWDRQDTRNDCRGSHGVALLHGSVSDDPEPLPVAVPCPVHHGLHLCMGLCGLWLVSFLIIACVIGEFPHQLVSTWF